LRGLGIKEEPVSREKAIEPRGYPFEEQRKRLRQASANCDKWTGNSEEKGHPSAAALKGKSPKRE